MIKKIILFWLAIVVVGQLDAQEKSLFTGEITVRKLCFPSKVPSIAMVEAKLDSVHLPFYPITTANWANFPYVPETQFRIAYNDDELFLQFVVREDYVRATYSDDETSNPYEDSCVEFFWMPNEDGIYYNLEFNAIGTLLFQGGNSRRERYRFSNEITSQVRRTSSLGIEPFETRDDIDFWRLTVVIPLSLFSLSPVAPLEGRTVMANFYKCGDKLPTPHYVSWNPVGTERPNFHTPQYFGILHFE